MIKLIASIPKLMKSMHLIIGVIMFFSACSSKENSTGDISIKTIPIATSSEDKQTFSQLVDSISFVALETTNQSLIGRITKLRFKDSRIYVLDKHQSNCLFVFGTDGHYLFKIDESGKGPGEFIEASGFCITEDHEIIINDFSGKKILFYNYEGEFLREFHTDFHPSDIAHLGQGLLALTSYYPSKRLIIMGIDGQMIRKEFDGEPRISHVYTNELITAEGKVYFREYFDDTIFQIDRAKIAKKYLVDFQEKMMGISNYLSIPLSLRNGVTDRYIPDGFRFGCHNLVETQEYLSFYFWETPKRMNRFWCLFNKMSGKTTYMNINGDFDDLFGDIDPPSILSSIDNQFCFPLDSYKLLGSLDQTLKNFAENMPSSLEKVSFISEAISNDSNPLLVFFSIK